jgi:hypothetical protein
MGRLAHKPAHDEPVDGSGKRTSKVVLTMLTGTTRGLSGSITVQAAVR